MRKLSTQETQWIYPKVDPKWVDAIIQEFKIHPVTAELLASRGFSTLEEINHHLYAKLPDLYDPNLLPNMDAAVDHIYTLYQNKSKILIYGDNDVDGITGAALLTEFFRSISIEVYYFIPSPNLAKSNPMIDGIEFAIKHGCSLMITVDCGITACDEVAEAKKRGIDVIITDHHEPTLKLPETIATLNPKLKESIYPNREITGVGVAFKFAHAITNHLISQGDIGPRKIDLKRYLDLVALGTISDMGSLLNENRILVRYGLRQLRKTKRIGLIKLFDVCELKTSNITPIDIASKVAPRLNSLGRIADPNKGVELLLILDAQGAQKLANDLEFNNVERQKIERKDSEDIDNMLVKNPDLLKDKALVLHSKKWHQGIIPIISARLAKQYNRPTAIIAIDDGVGKGSLRTIPEFPLLPTLNENASILLNYGGHDFAAGLTIKEENIETFSKNFRIAANKMLKTQDILFKLKLDAKIDFDDLTFDFMESLSLLEPFGNENPPPIFYCDAQQAWPPKIIGKTHLKLYLEQKDRILEGIAFGMAEKRSMLCKKGATLHVVFTPHINTFLNKSSIQLQVRDFKIQ